MHLLIVPRYAALLGLLYFTLTVRVIRYRRKHKISLGDGGHERLQRLMRSHSNFAEFTPMVLLLLCLVEAKGWPGGVVHGLCCLLTFGRMAHSESLPRASLGLRVFGMAATLLSLGISSLLLVIP